MDLKLTAYQWLLNLWQAVICNFAETSIWTVNLWWESATIHVTELREGLVHCSSELSPGSISIRITWELVRNANSQVSSWTGRIFLGWGWAIWFNQLSRWLWRSLKLENHWPCRFPRNPFLFFLPHSGTGPRKWHLKKLRHYFWYRWLIFTGLYFKRW